MHALPIVQAPLMSSRQRSRVLDAEPVCRRKYRWIGTSTLFQEVSSGNWVVAVIKARLVTQSERLELLKKFHALHVLGRLVETVAADNAALEPCSGLSALHLLRAARQDPEHLQQSSNTCN